MESLLEIPRMVGQVEMFMSIFNMLQEDRGRRATGNITFTEFEQLFNRGEIRAFFQVGLGVNKMSRVTKKPVVGSKS